MNREKTIIRTSIVGILGNFLLVAAKAVIGFIAGSISILMDAVNNLSDALSSIITIIGTKLSKKKPDAKHPYGHGRIEYVTSAIIAAIVLFAGGSAIYESIRSLIDQQTSNYDYISIIVVSVAIFIKIGLGLYFYLMAKKTNSQALKGSGIDALFDAALSAGTLVGIIVAMTAGVYIEGYIGIIIGLFIIKSGFGILKESLSSIIGERTSKETAEGIKQLVTSFDGVLGAYDLILNNYGPERAIGSIHIEVPDHLTAKEIHPLTRQIAESVYAKYGVIMTVGIYAFNDSNPFIQEMKSFLNELIKKYPDVKQTHGFYVDEKAKTISFDIIIDFKCKNSGEVRDEIYFAMQEKYKEYQFYIVLDSDFSD